jgi:hypothetical protein
VRPARRHHEFHAAAHLRRRASSIRSLLQSPSRCNLEQERRENAEMKKNEEEEMKMKKEEKTRSKGFQGRKKSTRST